MNPFKLLRKLGKLVRRVAPRPIFLGGLLGVMIGMVPGFNLTLVLGVVLLLLLNTHVGIGLLGILLGKALALALAPVTFQLGYIIIHKIGLEGLFRTLSDTPVVALMDLHYYCLVGGIPVGIVLGIVFGKVVVNVVNVLRKGIIEATEHSSRMARLAANPLVRVFLWIVFGRARGDLSALLSKHPPIFRKAGIVLVVLFVAIAGALEFLLLDRFLKAGIERGLGYVNGAEVDVGAADLSFGDGRLAVTDLQATDPDRPTHNSFSLKNVDADISVPDLLRKRVVIKLLEVDSVELGTQRTSPGEVYIDTTPPEPGETPTLTDYFEKARKYEEYLKKLKEYLDKRKTRQQEDEEADEKARERLRREARNRGYLALSAKDLLTDKPTWVIEEINVKGLPIALGESTVQDIHVANLTSHPEILRKQTLFRMGAPDAAKPLAMAVFHFEEPDLAHDLALDLPPIALGSFLKLSESAPVNVRDGLAKVTVNGKFKADQIDLPLTVALSNIEANSREGEAVLGMDPAMAQQVFAAVENFTLKGTIAGSLDAPTLSLSAPDMKQTMDSILASAKARLGDELTRRVRGKLDEAIKDAAGGLLDKESTGGLLRKIPGLGGDDEEDEEDEGGGLLDRLR